MIYNRPAICGEETPVTVCVAAIANNNTVFGASDRMLTAGDIQFEPIQPKILSLSNSICAMTAGDSSLQAEILQMVFADMGERIRREPANWWRVKDVAGLYSRHYDEARLKRSERTILSPLGLSHASFTQNQQTMSESLVRMLATELINFSLPPVATIFAGVDTTGIHLYVVEGGDVSCMDTVGFAAIGAGRWHANSQFMFAQHDRTKPGPETLLLTYHAKKRAEVAPGVGAGTDMFIMGPQLGSHTPIPPDAIADLEKMYKARLGRERRASTRANQEVNQYVENLSRAQTPPAQEAAPTDAGGNPSPNQGELRDGTQEGE
jgi:hypothetical protein